MAELSSGDPVRVRAYAPPGMHVRAPWYIRGRAGVIERALAEFPNPEQLAYGLQGDMKQLYRVRFPMAEIWGDDAETSGDTLDVEVYEHWLERL